ncbi:MAG TPA: DUF2652 domain-containing protein [Burkholderiales bacterium]|nr:DUF2652 domain-containing protein [Burkholderiales bacterium]
MTTQSADDAVLFFIPDIGGFTKFIAETEVRHSQHIVRELLELLVDANSIGMKVSEFEGDAVLFYRNGAPPSPQELVQQARQMYVAFHAYLKKFEYFRVCQCGACAGTGGITLKMVAHYGSAATMQVKDHVKFIGKDIIIAHRLLKNSVDVREYLLATSQTLLASGGQEIDAGSFVRGTDAYESLGTIEYAIRPLEGYRAEIHVAPPAPGGMTNPRRMATLTRTIDAPIEEVYQRIIDLPGRLDWIEGATRVDMSGDRENRIGKTHRCMRGEEGVELMTTEVKVSESTMELWETDLKKIMACRYFLTRTPGNATELALELYVRDNLFFRLMFRLLLQKKLTAFFDKSLDNLCGLFEKAGR